MLKRLILAALFALTSPAFGAGTISLSLTQQFGQDSKVLSGGKLFFIQAGTVSTPQNAFQDSALTIPWPNPITLDARGFVPQLFFADGNIKVRLTDKNGVTIFTADNLLVVGPSGGGGGGGTVDPTTILATGDLKVSYGTGILSGFVRANGRTIGSATSGATERANADTQALFQYLWGADANLSVSGGRGASAAADWAANKTITLPDWRGRALAGLDDMGNTASGRLTTGVFGTSPIVLGAAGGAQTITLLQSDLPNVAPTIDASTAVWNTVAASSASSFNGGGAPFGYTPNLFNGGTSGGGVSNFNSKAGLVGGSITASSINGGVGQTSPSKVQPTMLATIYLKL